MFFFSFQAHSSNQLGKTTVKDEKIFSMRLIGEPETLDWNIAHTMVETYLLMNLMEGLMTFDGLKPVASLAERWSKTDDGKTYTFYLKKGVKWSDGVELGANDFVYSWKRLLSPLTAASYAYFLFDIVGAEDFNKGKLKDFNKVGIKALDKYTLQVKLSHPVAYWIYIPTFWVTFPMRQDVIEKNGAYWTKPGRMLTLGPFTLEAYEPDSRIVLRANPNYHGKHGNIDKVIGLVVKDSSTAFKLYETNKLDFLTDIASTDLKSVKGRSDLKEFPYLKVVYLGLNLIKYPTNNMHLRRALSMAIDKSKIESILGGGQKRATTFVAKDLMGYSSEIGLPFDVKKAKSELALAGVSNTGESLTIELVIANWDKSILLAQFIQSELKKNLGINVIIQPFDHKTFRAQLDLKIYHMYITSWGADYPDPDNILSVFLSDSGNNRSSFKEEKKYDKPILEARLLQSGSEREKKYLQAQKVLLEDSAAVVPLYYEPNFALIKSRVKGLQINPLNNLYLRDVSVSK